MAGPGDRRYIPPAARGKQVVAAQPVRSFPLPAGWDRMDERVGQACRACRVGTNSVAMYVYSTGGDPVGFVFETNIFDLDGTPLGRIVGCRVHRFDGTYVGEWFRDMVVRRPQGRPRIIPPAPGE